MSGRLLSLGVALGLSGALAGAIIAACYEIPKPACGFLCGPSGACPDGYSCAADMYCHRNGTPTDLVCLSADARLPPDAADLDALVDSTDAAGDAGDAADDATASDAGDAPVGSMDAPGDAGDDAVIDAAEDAAIDAAGAAPPP